MNWINSLLFHVSDINQVSILLGRTKIIVCDDPSKFREFRKALNKRLKVFEKDLRENYEE